MAQVYILMDMMFWMKYLIVGYGRRRKDLENRKRQAVRELVSRPFREMMDATRRTRLSRKMLEKRSR